MTFPTSHATLAASQNVSDNLVEYKTTWLSTKKTNKSLSRHIVKYLTWQLKKQYEMIVWLDITLLYHTQIRQNNVEKMLKKTRRSMSSKEWYETVINLVLYKRSIEPTARNVSWSIERHVVFSDIIIHQQMQNLSDWLLAIYRIVRFLPSRCYCKASAVYVARYMLCLVHPSATRMNFYQNQWRECHWTQGNAVPAPPIIEDQRSHPSNFTKTLGGSQALVGAQSSHLWFSILTTGQNQLLLPRGCPIVVVFLYRPTKHSGAIPTGPTAALNTGWYEISSIFDRCIIRSWKQYCVQDTYTVTMQGGIL